MTSFKGRDLLLKIGDGAMPENFTTLGAARATSMTLDNDLQDATAMDAQGTRSYAALAGVQGLQIELEGLFKDAAAEELLRAAAFGRLTRNYQLFFPNGDRYAAAFVVASYTRRGAVEGLESFSAILLRHGEGTFTAAP